MIRSSLLAASFLAAAAAPALAFDPPAGADSREVRIPRMSQFLEWVPDGENGLFIRADTGRWFYARTREACPRLDNNVALRFDTRGGRDLDRFGAIRAEGWRCDLASVTESAGPPPRR